MAADRELQPEQRRGDLPLHPVGRGFLLRHGRDRPRLHERLPHSWVPGRRRGRQLRRHARRAHCPRRRGPDQPGALRPEGRSQRGVRVRLLLDRSRAPRPAPATDADAHPAANDRADARTPPVTAADPNPGPDPAADRDAGEQRVSVSYFVFYAERLTDRDARAERAGWEPNATGVCGAADRARCAGRAATSPRCPGRQPGGAVGGQRGADGNRRQRAGRPGAAPLHRLHVRALQQHVREQLRRDRRLAGPAAWRTGQVRPSCGVPARRRPLPGSWGARLPYARPVPGAGRADDCRLSGHAGRAGGGDARLRGAAAASLPAPHRHVARRSRAAMDAAGRRPVRARLPRCRPGARLPVRPAARARLPG